MPEPRVDMFVNPPRLVGFKSTSLLLDAPSGQSEACRNGKQEGTPLRKRGDGMDINFHLLFSPVRFTLPSGKSAVMMNRAQRICFKCEKIKRPSHCTRFAECPCAGLGMPCDCQGLFPTPCCLFCSKNRQAGTCDRKLGGCSACADSGRLCIYRFPRMGFGDRKCAFHSMVYKDWKCRGRNHKRNTRATDNDNNNNNNNNNNSNVNGVTVFESAYDDWKIRPVTDRGGAPVDNSGNSGIYRHITVFESPHDPWEINPKGTAENDDYCITDNDDDCVTDNGTSPPDNEDGGGDHDFTTSDGDCVCSTPHNTVSLPDPFIRLFRVLESDC
ncbi:hypothetical protein FN846DRAFT_231691 [Sphaerosporella brunnea]|uniref:Uncharacterized protein n=1 Tax=Sphaerosporella brunnea TaxID=1250544 RepID=A0A5J5ENF5_9PEZI|nr:hypothetical protein FN846DRAFT_231691 [Sphaerosporella brunnea]